MHTRRIATFILGAWIGCSLMMVAFQIANVRFTGSLLSTPSDPAAALLKHGSQQDYALMMHYQAAEQNRRYEYVWEEVEFGLGVILGATLFLGTQRRIFPMVICGLMVLMLIFEHVGVSPEFAFRGRQIDFPPGNAAVGPLLRMYAMEQIYAWVEGTKLLLGILLAGYLFIFRARRVRVNSDLIDERHHSQVAR